MILDKVDHDKCCGCGACAAICQRRCVEITCDNYGFPHPVKREVTCNDCGLCDRVCPALSQGLAEEGARAYWAKSNDSALRESSSSGGIFGLLAHYFIEVGGVVYGAALTSDCKAVEHVRVDNEQGVSAVMRSKYLQSLIKESLYQAVANDLKNGLYVLFSGTACQIAGLKAFTEAKKCPDDKLLLVDVICHGVPSPKLWKLWVEKLVRNEQAEIEEINFRNKITGWTDYSVSYRYDTQKIAAYRFSSDWYMNAFLSNASLRSSCFNCPSKRSCGSDITLGDFWGIQSSHPEVDYEGGVSAIVCNTKKGVMAIESVSNDMTMGISSLERILSGNPCLIEPVSPFEKYDSFMEDLGCGVSIDQMMKKYPFKPSLLQKIRRLVSITKSRARELSGC